jgi:hypothetical protein
LKQLGAVGAVVAALGDATAFAGIVTADLGKNIQFTQTDDVGTLGSENDYFAARAFYDNTTAFDSGSLTINGGTAITMTNVPGTYMFLNGNTAAGYYIAQSGSFGSQSDLDTAYPFGLYDYNLNFSTDTSQNDTTTIDYTQDYYPNQPIVSSTSFDQLAAGIDPTKSFTLNFNQLIDNSNLSQAPSPSDYVFLDIFNGSTDAYSNFSATPSNTTNFVIPAGTLSLGTAYNVVLTFDNRTFDGSDFQLFDTKTDVGFTTASAPSTPEPAMFLPALTGLGVIAWMRRRFRHSFRSQRGASISPSGRSLVA